MKAVHYAVCTAQTPKPEQSGEAKIYALHNLIPYTTFKFFLTCVTVKYSTALVQVCLNVINTESICSFFLY